MIKMTSICLNIMLTFDKLLKSHACTFMAVVRFSEQERIVDLLMQKVNFAVIDFLTKLICYLHSISALDMFA